MSSILRSSGGPKMPLPSGFSSAGFQGLLSWGRSRSKTISLPLPRLSFGPFAPWRAAPLRRAPPWKATPIDAGLLAPLGVPLLAAHSLSAGGDGGFASLNVREYRNDRLRDPSLRNRAFLDTPSWDNMACEEQTRCLECFEDRGGGGVHGTSLVSEPDSTPPYVSPHINPAAAISHFSSATVDPPGVDPAWVDPAWEVCEDTNPYRCVTSTTSDASLPAESLDRLAGEKSSGVYDSRASTLTSVALATPFRFLRPSPSKRVSVCNLQERSFGSKSREAQNTELQRTRDIAPKHFMHKDARSTTPMSSTVEAELHWESETKSSLPHPIWSDQTVKAVEITHVRPAKIVDKLAYAGVKTLRTGFDLLSGYSLGFVDEKVWVNRIIFLETVAGVPGLVGAMVRHLRSLRRMERDYGWIHTLLEEAENERMHLMSALQLKTPSFLFRLFVLATQGLFLPFFTVGYVLSPHFAHRFVGYLEEEAVKTYTHLLETLEKGNLPNFQNLTAPYVARQYWELPENASFKEMIYAIRADESHHRDVNHTFAAMRRNEPNPFAPGH